MAGKHRNTNSPKDAVKKKLSLQLSTQADEYINQQAVINMRSYAAQIIFMLEEDVKVALYKEDLDRNMPGWRTQEKAITDEEIRKIIAEEKAKEFEKKLEDKKKEEEQIG